MNDFFKWLLGIEKVDIYPGSDWEIIWTNLPEVWIVVLIIIPAVVAFSYFFYRRERGSGSPAVKVMLALIRAALILLVVLVIFQPKLVVELIFQKDPHIAILIDDSLSMEIQDKLPSMEQKSKLAEFMGITDGLKVLTLDEERRTDSLTRADIARRILTHEKLNLAKNLEARGFIVKPFLFSVSVRAEPNPQDFKPTGSVTRIGDALLDTLARLRGQYVYAIILITDGRSTSGTPPTQVAPLLANHVPPIPIYAIGIGNPERAKDIALVNLTAPAIATTDDPVLFEFTIQSQGFENEEVFIFLKRGDSILEQVKQTLTGEPSQRASITYKPTQPGEYSVTIEIPAHEAEIIKENNYLTHHLQVIDKKIRVIYADGYPRYEYRYLKNALIRDDSMVAVCYLQSADKGFIQESSRGVPPITGIPLDKNLLFSYDVIIFGDVDPSRLTPPPHHPEDQDTLLNLISEFVEKMGGGFLMIAGERYSPMHFKGTPIEKMLPVVLEEEPPNLATRGVPLTEAFRLSLTPQGLEHPIMKLVQDSRENMRLWQSDDGLPGMYWYYAARKPKPGAIVLAEHPFHSNRYGKRPLIAIQYFGRGRTMFAAVDETWRWRYGVGDRYFYTFWRQALAFLKSGKLLGGKRLILGFDRAEIYLGERIKISAEVLDESYSPVQREEYTIKLESPDEIEKELVLKVVPGQVGHFETSFLPERVGRYRVTLPPPSPWDEQEEVVDFFTVSIPSLEFENPTMDRETLAEITSITGGKLYAPWEAYQLLDDIGHFKELKMTGVTEDPLWDSPLVLLLFTALITTEWIVRRMKRML